MPATASVPYEFNPDVRHLFFINRRAILSGISKHAPQLKGKLLDFGCGSKPYRSLFDADEYIGLDYENEGYSPRNEQIDVFYDGKRIPFPNETFDSVLATEVFEHVFYLDDTLKEINRVMKESGKLLISCPFVWNEHLVPFDFARYSSFGMTALLERNGFSVLAMEKTSNFVETLFQMRLLYLNATLFRLIKALPLAGGFFKTALICLTNLAGVFFGKILPDKRDLYLGLVVLAQKEKK